MPSADSGQNEISDRLADIDRKIENLNALHDQFVQYLAKYGIGQNFLISQVRELQQLMRVLQVNFVVLPNLWSPLLGDKIRGLMRLLTPLSAADCRKIRVGRDFDGGYVMLDDFDGVQSALSLGINDDDSWDQSVSQRGVHVFQYDHTIDQGPTPSKAMTFSKMRVSSADGPDRVSLETLIRERVAAGDSDLILKMDIESDEWDVLDATSPALMKHFRQIICEFHHLNGLADDQFFNRAERCFKKLADLFFVCHVHGNNCGGVLNIGNIPLPDTLEVTFANRSRYRTRDTTELFPGSLDMPNQPDRADIFLGSFRF